MTFRLYTGKFGHDDAGSFQGHQAGTNQAAVYTIALQLNIVKPPKFFTIVAREKKPVKEIRHILN